ncbi:MAG: FAD-dependent oxidoreductase [Candidatus Solibacter sp.]|nr:FAD-dependent oxidoreductase [Candidatus Solibacter sp.]
MDWLGMMPGKRGSRRLVGDYLLKQRDLMEGSFPDAVAIGGWSMDGHPPEGFDRPDLPPNTVLAPPEVYDIPLRSLYSRNISNLLMAGRNISASYVAFTSARVMATCAVIGQAVGTAAAQCVEGRLLPRELARDARQIAKLRQTLLRDDQTIKGLTNQDPLDLARTAKVSASAESGAAKAALLLDGHVRDIPDKRGDPAEVHHWAAPVGEGRPAWVELRWERPQRIREVQITFDSGFKRQLTLSSQESQNVNLLRAAQPETVKDYTLVARTADGKERTLATVKNNFQRLNRHRFEAAEVQSVRIEALATNGDALARIFEIRCYA